jgi:hypothetical protein
MIASVERVPLISLIQAFSGKAEATHWHLMTRGLRVATTAGARSAILCPASHLSDQKGRLVPLPRVAVVTA